MMFQIISALLLLATCSYCLSADYDYHGSGGEQFLTVKVGLICSDLVSSALLGQWHGYYETAGQGEI